jgi:hypothetical protein
MSELAFETGIEPATEVSVVYATGLHGVCHY